MTIKKNIILVDDHIIIRNGLKELIEKLGSYHVAYEFDNGESFLASISDIAVTTDLVIVDISMPGMNGHEVLIKLNEQQIKIPVLILTLDENDELVVKLFRLGARGYLRKNCTAQVLKNALEEIFEKGFYHNEFLAYSLRNNVEIKKNEAEVLLGQLTAREKEFLKWVCHENELTYVQIADKMDVQPRTVDGYRESIFQKFDIKSKTGLVLFVIKHRLFDYF